MFDITAEVFGLEYRKIEETGAWHSDVALYSIHDRGNAEPLAYFYADLFPREGKYGHAAAFPIVYGRTLADGTYRKPVAAIIANFTKPTAGRPSLLRHSEALTLFHEFGHILHFCLTTVPLIRFSGFDAEWTKPVSQPVPPFVQVHLDSALGTLEDLRNLSHGILFEVVQCDCLGLPFG